MLVLLRLQAEMVKTFVLGSSATAGECSGIIGLRDSSVHFSRVSNSCEFICGCCHVCMCAVLRVPCLVLPPPRSWSTVARLSDC